MDNQSSEKSYGYGYDDSGYGYDDSGYGYDDTGYGYGDTGYGYDDSGYGYGDKGYGYDDTGYGYDDGYGNDEQSSWGQDSQTNNSQDQNQEYWQAQAQPEDHSQSRRQESSPFGPYNAAVGQRLANEAIAEANRTNTIGWCYRHVANVVDVVIGRFLTGNDAYMAADQFANHPRFSEISTSNLAGLPAGAIVVWGRGDTQRTRSGHISISLGDGREASDHIDLQMTYHPGNGRARVFVPN